MTRLEKCEYAINKGYTYNPETGKVYNKFGVEMTAKINDYPMIQLHKDKKRYNVSHHQFAWYCIYKEVVECIDHINQNKTDNRIINLRSVSHQQNSFNTDAKGYYWHKGKNKWRTLIRLNNKEIHLGYFNNEDEAKNKYLEVKKTLHII